MEQFGCAGSTHRQARHRTVPTAIADVARHSAALSCATRPARPR